MKASDLANTDFIPTGTFIDRLVGGLPRGKIVEIWGQESVGKSTLALQVIEAAQKQGLKCCYVDVEYSYDPRYAEHLGVDNSKVGIIRDKSAEVMLDQAEDEIKKWDVMVLDSVGALHSLQQMEKPSGEKTIGVQASLTAQFVRRLVPLLFEHNATLLVLNHGFTDIMAYGAPYKPSGGAKLAYHKSVSIQLSGGKLLSEKGDDSKTPVGKRIIATVRKDKILGNEGKKLELDFIFGQGFSKSADLLGMALGQQVIKKDGRFYVMPDGTKLFGMPKVREWTQSHEEELKQALAV